MNGKYFSGQVKAFSFQLFGMTVTGASGGLAEEHNFAITTSADNYNEVDGLQTPNILAFNFSSSPFIQSNGVLIRISFTDFDQGDICFANEIGACDTPNQVNLFSDGYGECISNIIWDGCYRP